MALQGSYLKSVPFPQLRFATQDSHLFGEELSISSTLKRGTRLGRDVPCPQTVTPARHQAALVLGLRPLPSAVAPEPRRFPLPLSKEPGGQGVLRMARRACCQNSGCPYLHSRLGGGHKTKELGAIPKYLPWDVKEALLLPRLSKGPRWC